MSWLSIDTWLIVSIALGYLTCLFLLAYWAQNTSHQRWISNPWVLGLGLGVSCTSWAFYGVIGQAAITGYWLSPIYIGTISCMVLLWPLLRKLLRISKQHNLSSLADFLALRYQAKPSIAGLVTLITILGMIPYIALQLRAVSQSFDLVTGTLRTGFKTTAIVTLVMIIFTVLFGAGRHNMQRYNPGLVFAIAFSSVLKLLALTALGIYISFFLFEDAGQVMQLARELQKNADNTPYFATAQVVLGALTVITLPALFHMLVVENHHERHLQKARWIYPAYLVAINLFVLPIALAGLQTFPGDTINADTFALTLPLFHQQATLSIVVFIGGIAAALSMVIIAAVVLSNMIVTDLLAPLAVRARIATQPNDNSNFAGQLLTQRRVSIATVLILALCFEQLIKQEQHLANIGLLAFVLLSQTAPALIAGLYWRQATASGAVWGMLAGSGIWFYCLLIPAVLPDSQFVQYGPLGNKVLQPTNLLPFTGWDSTTSGIVMSLLCNTLLLISRSLFNPDSNQAQHAERFVGSIEHKPDYLLSYQQLLVMLARFCNAETANAFQHQLPVGTNLQHYAATEELERAQQLLASVLGSATTQLLLSAAAADSGNIDEQQVADFVTEASQVLQFNRELLNAAVENIDQGISVVDANMCLVAWNRRYQSILEYPENYLQAGMPIDELLRYNLQRGLINADDAEQQIAKRIDHMRSGRDHWYRRTLPSGQVIEIRGQPMPGGGFVSTFSDITEHVRAQQALTIANDNLEQRVAERTEALSRAKLAAETANRSKSRFLAAASHDLMQPFNALSLFTDMLHQQLKGSEQAQLTSQIRGSLDYVESLLSDLVEISKLDGQSAAPQWENFAIAEVLTPLAAEFQLIAQQKSVRFDYIPSSCWVHSDRHYLRRIVQNLLSNAIQYSRSHDNPRVVLGVRRLADNQLSINVIDNGPGIPEAKQALIFKEFERLDIGSDHPGLGLGLAICERIATLLDTSIQLYSRPKHGACFSLCMAQAQQPMGAMPSRIKKDKPQADEALQLPILAIDNDAPSLAALCSQLRDWGCDVRGWRSSLDWQQTADFSPRLIIADYHLDEEETGLALAADVASSLTPTPAVIICSADSSEAVRQACIDNGYTFLRKPIKPLALKRVIRQLSAAQA